MYPQLKRVREGQIPASELRAAGSEVSLLGSATMIRVLATAYRALREGDDRHEPMTHEDIIAFFGTLPVEAGCTDPDDKEKAQPLLSEIWRNTDAFAFPWTAPSASMGDIRGLVSHVVEWAHASHP